MALGSEGEAGGEAYERYKAQFREALENDLNTSLAVTCVYDVLKDKELAPAAKRALIAEFDKVLSLDLLKEEEAPKAGAPDAAYIEERIAARAAAKKAKNYAEADRIRSELAEQGVTLIDTPAGTTYKL